MNLDFNTVKSIRLNLIKWFNEYGRPLPWRKDNSWYKTFLSEFLLQQTQVEQALPYYDRFYGRFPDITALAEATEHEILTMWAGLGYYARAKNLLKAARSIHENHNDNFPMHYDEALSLPGIGPYTASSILSLAFNQPRAVVDGNVTRVISRLFEITGDIRQSSTEKLIHSISRQLLDPQFPGKFNEAMMELGALVCRPVSPACGSCPLQSVCLANQNSSTGHIPYKSKRTGKKNHFQYVFLIVNNGSLLIMKRKPTGLLASMWELPILPVNSFDLNSSGMLEILMKKYGIRGSRVEIHEQLQHVYTHILLKYVPVTIKTESPEPLLNDYVEWRWEKRVNLKNYPIHNAHKKIFGYLKIKS
ncbi:MAG: A/G-specific adenine glycosylase [Calditrichaceae bacterium]